MNLRDGRPGSAPIVAATLLVALLAGLSSGPEPAASLRLAVSVPNVEPSSTDWSVPERPVRLWPWTLRA